jgi:hypothetical protein
MMLSVLKITQCHMTSLANNEVEMILKQVTMP